MTGAEVIEVVGRLHDANVDFWIEGGWGVDALLGEQTRAHDDLDLGVRMQDVDRICKTLPEFDRDDSDWPSSFVLTDTGRRKIDCHPLTFDENGDGWQASRVGGPPHRWPHEHLQAQGTIDGVEVTCISAELQLRWHVYDDFDDLDWQDVTALAERFSLEVPPLLRERPGFLAPKRR